MVGAVNDGGVSDYTFLVVRVLVYKLVVPVINKHRGRSSGASGKGAFFSGERSKSMTGKMKQ